MPYVIKNFDALWNILNANIPICMKEGKREVVISPSQVLGIPYGTMLAYFDLERLYINFSYDQYYNAARQAKWRLDRATAKLEAYPASTKDGFETNGIVFCGTLRQEMQDKYPPKVTKTDPVKVRLSAKYFHLRTGIYKVTVNSGCGKLYLWWDSETECTGFVIREGDDYGRRYAEKVYLDKAHGCSTLTTVVGG